MGDGVMTKVRFKALLAVVVALSLFVCSVVPAFAVNVSGTPTFAYTFPSFSSVKLTAPLNGSWREVSSSSVSLSPPLSSFSHSSAFTVSDPKSYVQFAFTFSYSDYSYTDLVTKRVQSYKFSSISPVSVPVSISISTSAPSSVMFRPRVYCVIPNYPRFDISPNVSIRTTSSWSAPGNYLYTFSLPYDISPSFVSSFMIFFALPIDAGHSFDFNSVSISFPSAVDPVLIDSSFNLNKDTSAAQNMVIINSINGLTQDIRQMFGPFLLQSTAYLSSLNSYFLSQSEKEENIYSDAVPDGLKDQQQAAQNQLTDYENKEQAVFDNLNTSLDDLNLDQYTTFSPSILSSMSFVNRYVTGGFDGLGDFKIILFLPMVLGIGLSVIGRMGHMLSNRPTRGRGDDP